MKKKIAPPQTIFVLLQIKEEEKSKFPPTESHWAVVECVGMCSSYQDCYVYQFSDDYVDVRY